MYLIVVYEMEHKRFITCDGPFHQKVLSLKSHYQFDQWNYEEMFDVDINETMGFCFKGNKISLKLHLYDLRLPLVPSLECLLPEDRYVDFDDSANKVGSF